MICLSGVTVFDKHVGLMDKARCKSKYDLNLIAEQAALTTASDNSPSSSSSSSLPPNNTLVPERRRSTPSEILAHQSDEFNANVTTVFAPPPPTHLGHSSSGEIVFLKTLHDGDVKANSLFLDNKSSETAFNRSSISVSVSAIKVKNLVSKAYIGKANPYVVITLGGVRLKTKVKWNESSAAWSEVLEFKDIARSLRSVGQLDVKVYDKERLARKTLLGAVTLNIDGMALAIYYLLYYCTSTTLQISNHCMNNHLPWHVILSIFSSHTHTPPLSSPLYPLTSPSPPPPRCSQAST
jgi:hypothetical protein